MAPLRVVRGQVGHVISGTIEGSLYPPRFRFFTPRVESAPLPRPRDPRPLQPLPRPLPGFVEGGAEGKSVRKAVNK